MLLECRRPWQAVHDLNSETFYSILSEKTAKTVDIESILGIVDVHCFTFTSKYN
jgi:hypothetical protein